MAQHFLENYAWIYRREIFSLSLKLFERFLLYPWPRNIAELEEIIKEVVIWGEEKVLREKFKEIPKVKLKFKDLEDMLSKVLKEEKEIRAQIESSRKDQGARRTGSQ